MLLLAAVQAPITSVTVYGDRARVVRATSFALTGVQTVEFPLLHGNVDPASIQVEATGAQVQRVDIELAEAAAFASDAARKATAALEQIDDRLALAKAERDARELQIRELRAVAPTVPKDEPKRPTPRLDGSGWKTATRFIAERIARLQRERQQSLVQIATLERERATAAADAARLGDGRPAPGLRVRAVLKGNANARIALSYETSGAQWRPSYEVQYLPDRGTVILALSGLVSQQTGEDWDGVRLTLSTARPARFEPAPELLVWRIGQLDGFVPTPTPVALRPEPAPGAAALPPAAPAPPVRPRKRVTNGGVIVGNVLDASTKKGVSDVVVTVTSTGPLGEESVVVTDANGRFRSNLVPAGECTLRFEREGYKPYARSGVPVTAGRMGQLNVELLADSLTSEEIVVVGKPAPVDLGSVSASNEFSERTLLALGPPQAFLELPVEPDSPAAEAEGLDLAYTSSRPETVRTGKGVVRIGLVAETWPVTVSRKVFPAVSPQTYLVARLKSPAKAVLPGGPAAISVGTDPAGTARLPVIRPGEDLTLPLGVDRELVPIRNVQLIQSEKGFLSRDDTSEVRVTLEMANPYPIPIDVTFVDQVPVREGEHLEVKLLETKPWARQNAETGRLEWDVRLPPSGKTVASYRYRVVRPKGWKLQQSEAEAMR